MKWRLLESINKPLCRSAAHKPSRGNCSHCLYNMVSTNVCFIFLVQSAKVDPRVWTDEEKAQLADAIDMYGVSDPKRLAERVPTKKLYLVIQMLRDLQTKYRKEAECADMRRLSFVDLNAMDDLFLAGGTRPRDVMLKWMDFLEEFYGKDPFQYDKFKLFSRAFLVMSECTPPSTAMMRVTVDAENPSREEYVDLRWVVAARRILRTTLDGSSITSKGPGRVLQGMISGVQTALEPALVFKPWLRFLYNVKLWQLPITQAICFSNLITSLNKHLRSVISETRLIRLMILIVGIFYYKTIDSDVSKLLCYQKGWSSFY